MISVLETVGLMPSREVELNWKMNPPRFATHKVPEESNVKLNGPSTAPIVLETVVLLLASEVLSNSHISGGLAVLPETHRLPRESNANPDGDNGARIPTSLETVGLLLARDVVLNSKILAI